MAAKALPAMGYGLRYEHGIFKQSFRNGWQEERPDNRLRYPDPWEVVRPAECVEVQLGCTIELRDGSLRLAPNNPSTLLGVPYDRPWLAMAARRSIRCASGPRRPRIPSTSNGSARATLSPPWPIRSEQNR
jgi:starch phosphorylase